MKRIFEFDLEEESADFRRLNLPEKLNGYGRFRVQTRCPSDLGIIGLRVSEFKGETDFQMIWNVTSEEIPYEFHQGVIKGIKRWSHLNEIKDLKVVITDGKFHLTDSRMFSYEMATVFALNDAFKDILPKEEVSKG